MKLTDEQIAKLSNLYVCNTPPIDDPGGRDEMDLAIISSKQSCEAYARHQNETWLEVNEDEPDDGDEQAVAVPFLAWLEELDI